MEKRCLLLVLHGMTRIAGAHRKTIVRVSTVRSCKRFLDYANEHGMPNLKVIFVNDGPGLLLGSMWADYAHIEEQMPGRVKVATLRMVPESHHGRVVEVVVWPSESLERTDAWIGVSNTGCASNTPVRRQHRQFLLLHQGITNLLTVLGRIVCITRIISACCQLLRGDRQVAGKVRLIYIDPPFSTATIFESRKQRLAYADDLTGPAFVESLRERLIWLHRLLADDGSLYLHLDERMISLHASNSR